MNTALLRIGAVVLLAFSLSGCAQYLYDWAQDSRAANCRQLPLGDERIRCEKQARDMSYERYRSEAAQAKAASNPAGAK